MQANGGDQGNRIPDLVIARYENDLKDHLGNNRVTFIGKPLTGAIYIARSTSYYPFGLVMYQFNGTRESGYKKNLYLYNGNIVGIKWGIKNDIVRGYQFSYDELNRLLQSNYSEGSLLNTNPGYFSEIITGYDKNGNIQGLQRMYNNIMVDNLDYDYSDTGKSNQLLRITDTGTLNSDIDDYPGTSSDYSYDANGNMTFDGAKNLTIDYYENLNLPQKIDFDGYNRIYYHYSATGAKLIKHKIPESVPESLTHYIGNIVYEDDSLSYILTEEGRLVAIGEGTDREFLYEYNLKDHLGNSRVTFMGTDLGGAVDIVQTTNYYPFGLVMSQTNESYSGDYRKNKYLYNGKELQDDVIAGSSLNWYDYGARFYDPQIGRWTTPDPSAEKYYSASPYVFCGNNPIKFLDIDGRDYGLHFNRQNKSVTVSATYYAVGSDMASANQAASSFNNQSGNNTYTIGKGDAATTYTVNYDIKVVEVGVDSKMGEMGSLNSALSSDKSGEGNVYKIVSDSKLDANTNGSTSGGNYIQVKDSRQTTETGAHEMGHSLGLAHNTTGLMTPSSTDPSRSNNINKTDVKDMISYPTSGKVNYEYDSKGNKVYSGKGTVVNNTTNTNDDLKKGKVQ